MPDIHLRDRQLNILTFNKYLENEQESDDIFFASSAIPYSLRIIEDCSYLDILHALIACEAGNQSNVGQFAIGCVVRNRWLRASAGVITWWGTTFKQIILKKHQYSCLWEDWDQLQRRFIETVYNRRRYPESFVAASQALSMEIPPTIPLVPAKEDLFSAGDKPWTHPDITFGADHYFNQKVLAKAGKLPKWAEKMVKTVGIGDHVFFNSIA